MNIAPQGLHFLYCLHAETDQAAGEQASEKIPVTVFENHRKSLIQHCERSELRLHFERTKVNQKCQKWSILVSF